MSTLKVDTISEKTASGGITFSQDITATLSSSSNIKGPLNASGDAPVYACRAWVNFRGTTQSGTATASGLVSGQYTATVTSATQFTVEYSATTYTINTSGNHEIGDGEGVDLTVSGTTVTIDTQIRASGNVSSITDNGTGAYTVNFTNAMPDTNYAIAAATIGSSGSGTPFRMVEHTAVGSRSTSSVSFYILTSASTPVDGTGEVSVFR